MEENSTEILASCFMHLVSVTSRRHPIRRQPILFVSVCIKKLAVFYKPSFIRTVRGHLPTQNASLIQHLQPPCIHFGLGNVSASTGNAPGALAFHRDMLIDVPLQADLRAIRARRQLRVDAEP
ncbi:hypothetical protein THAOC_31230 [Thalassiosira oceanica]|uniref:Uncharacterized protein n=1 Tax=Thalassiosira oceanica TaxID=159749 RepID=K0RT56_THAOC|nr:hypothetical protein THAOC_31230 [Thalassiosira oceanica]|eukprot:EJK49852.1 hypothetical protein THAOC_31230 [Thalassiosira oceanica]